MPYNSYKDKLSISKVNYNFIMKVHLYYNKDSNNRESDSLPMFYLKPVTLESVEKVAFSKKSESKGYLKHANRFWKYKHADELSNELIEHYFLSIKNSYPYGFKEGDDSSKLKYNQDVKFNKAFQSFYKKYWFNNLDKVKNPQRFLSETGVYFLNYPLPYIEFTVNEVITTKFPKGQYTPLSSRPSYGSYGPASSVFSQPNVIFCEKTDVDASIKVKYEYDLSGQQYVSVPNLYLNNFPNYTLSLAKNRTYFFHLKSGLEWPKIESGAESGSFNKYSLRFSSGKEGVHNGFEEYTNNIERFEGPSPDRAFTISVENKTNQHPYFSQGSALGYRINEGSLSGMLNLTRGDKHTFTQTGSSYDIEHPLYISTSPLGEGEFVYSKGVNIIESSGRRTVNFTIPYDAPDTLYYSCTHHGYMGGALNISNPPSHPLLGNLPGHVVKASFNVGSDVNSMYYYVNEVSGMGGKIYLSDLCPE